MQDDTGWLAGSGCMQCCQVGGTRANEASQATLLSPESNGTAIASH